jgi:hypothetical protein
MRRSDLAPGWLFTYSFRPVEVVTEVGRDVLWLLECGHTAWERADGYTHNAGGPNEFHCQACADQAGVPDWGEKR